MLTKRSAGRAPPPRAGRTEAVAAPDCADACATRN